MIKLLAPRDLAEILHVSVGHIYRLIRRRCVPFVKIGGAVRFRSESIDKWIAQQEIVTVAQVLRGKRS
jgi:excisionase family DNA binding protein